MAISAVYYLPQYLTTNVVGGAVTSTTMTSDIFQGSEFNSFTVESPPRGKGILWQYVKLYVALTDVDGGSRASDVKVFFNTATHPQHLLLAPDSSYTSFISGSYVYGNQSVSGLWYEGTTGSPTEYSRPTFVHSNGLTRAVTLYNSLGEQGGQVQIGASTGNAMPFWIARRLDENIDPNTIYFQLGISATKEQ